MRAPVLTGFMGIKNANAAGGAGKGMAIGGILLGGFYFIGMIIAVIFLFAFGGLSMIMSAVG